MPFFSFPIVTILLIKSTSICRNDVQRFFCTPLYHRQTAMDIQTSRFGTLEIDPQDILLFPAGIIGMEDCRHWVLLSDDDNEAVGWLQSLTDADLALSVVSPRRFDAEYQLKTTRSDLAPLCLEAADEAFLLGILTKNGPALTVNLKAPLVINLQRRLGAQVIAVDDQPIQHEIARQPALLRKSA